MSVFEHDIASVRLRWPAKPVFLLVAGLQAASAGDALVARSRQQCGVECAGN